MSFDTFIIAAPPGVLDRRYVLAHGLRILRPGGNLIALAPKDRGGARLADELRSFGCDVLESGKRHDRICRTIRPAAPLPIADAMIAGGLQLVPEWGLWSQPGIFSWDRLDAGTALLIRHLPALTGTGAEFGCGNGVLARAILVNDGVDRLTLIDIDRRAIDAARRNVPDPRAHFVQGDLRTQGLVDLGALDFVIMNPPFHDGGREDRELGEAFIRKASASLRPKGVCWLVANRHLPYERSLQALFASIRLVEQVEGYKIYEAKR